ncbi:hypothetical protein Droror1_Dr00027399, partial [Drosera rotundifolia]
MLSILKTEPGVSSMVGPEELHRGSENPWVGSPSSMITICSQETYCFSPVVQTTEKKRTRNGVENGLVERQRVQEDAVPVLATFPFAGLMESVNLDRKMKNSDSYVHSNITGLVSVLK